MNLLPSTVSTLPPILSVEEAQQYFKLGKTTLYALATAGEIQSLTIGAPGLRGKRAFLTESLLAYVNRRVAASPKLSTFRNKAT